MKVRNHVIQELAMKKISSSCSLRLAIMAIMLGSSAACLTQSAHAQTPALAASSAVLSGVAPLTDQSLSQISGMGLTLTKANPLTPGAGSVVLWDEVSRTPRSIPKPVPGLRIIVNGVPQ